MTHNTNVNEVAEAKARYWIALGIRTLADEVLEHLDEVGQLDEITAADLLGVAGSVAVWKELASRKRGLVCAAWANRSKGINS